jgi:phospholipase/carboxylesterase
MGVQQQVVNYPVIILPPAVGKVAPLRHHARFVLHRLVAMTFFSASEPLAACQIIAPAHGQPERLFLYLHGAGTTALGMKPLAEGYASSFRRAVHVVAEGAQPHDRKGSGGLGRQWYPTIDLGDANRSARVAAGLPAVESIVRAAQAAYGIAPAETVLLGFSQGAIMALELVQAQPPESGIAGCVIAFAGRLANPPRHGAPGTRFHLLHGLADKVIPPSFSEAAARELAAQGAGVTLDLLPETGHTMTPGMFKQALLRLKQG